MSNSQVFFKGFGRTQLLAALQTAIFNDTFLITTH